MSDYIIRQVELLAANNNIEDGLSVLSFNLDPINHDNEPELIVTNNNTY